MNNFEQPQINKQETETPEEIIDLEVLKQKLKNIKDSIYFIDGQLAKSEPESPKYQELMDQRNRKVQEEKELQEKISQIEKI